MSTARRLVRVVVALALLHGGSLAARAESGPGTLTIAAVDPPASLAGRWRFQTGDDPAWASPAFDDSGWELLQVPGDWGRQGHDRYAGLAWYRLTVQLPPGAAREGALAVAIGRVHSAYELYAGGQRIGGAGRLPPDPQVLYDHDATWVLPTDAVSADGRLVLALRVWKGAGTARHWQGGPYEGAFLVGRSLALAERSWGALTLPLVLGVLYLVIGLYHVHLYRRSPALREYLWYGLLTAAVGSYAVLVSPWKHEVPISWGLLKRLEYANLGILPLLAMQSIWTLLGIRPGRLLRAYRNSFLVITAVALFAPDLRTLFLTLDVWHAWMLPCLFGLCGLVVWRAASGHPEARTVLLGVAFFSLTALNDSLLDQRLLRNPRLVPVGFAAFILSMAVSLANRFARVFRDLQQAQATLVRTEKLSAIGGMAAGIVHDLRNPVAAIHTYAALIAARGDAEQKQMVQRIQDETTRSVDMMEDLLAFARGKVVVAPHEVDLARWLRDLEEYMRRELEFSMVEVSVRGPSEGRAVFDPARLRRVLCNLAWNARDAMPDGGRFEIAVEQAGGGLRIACTDTGPGVPAEIRPRLFAEFATHGKKNGTGLGLALSRAIVLEHGGTIRHEDPPGGGARFVIDLPPPA